MAHASLLLAVLFTSHVAGQGTHHYKGCVTQGPQLTIRLLANGHCLQEEHCRFLENCTTLHGSLIVRSPLENLNVSTIKPSFKYLREITGYLVITFFNQDVFKLLPSLAVIRGRELVGNYAFIVYLNTHVKGIHFRSLTTILKGGVRIDRNKQLCYVNSVRWKSIVKDNDQKEEFGIVMKSNHLDCDSACYTDQCFPAAGHSNNPKTQFCWGPGTEDDYQCQKFCNTNCGLAGCMNDKADVCCDGECLGGCSKSDSNLHCHACQHFRIWKTGQCVSKCPANTYLVDKIFCKQECPGWSYDDDDSTVVQQYALDGECVKDCPAGYSIDTGNRACRKCVKDCPRVCVLPRERPDGHLYHGVLIRVPADIPKKGLIGCTEIHGSLKFQIQDGTGDAEEFLNGLKTIKKIRGHVDVKGSNLKNLNFFENLEVIDPPQLIHGRYAIQIFENENLESLWRPLKSVNITKGQIFAQSNSRLCPKEVYNLQKMMVNLHGGNVTGDISDQTNGNRVPCEVERLEIEVKEVNSQNEMDILTLPAEYWKCAIEKCLDVTWNLTKTTQSYNIIFYQIYYRRLDEGEQASEDIVSDVTDNLKWKSLDVQREESIEKVQLFKRLISSVTPFSVYAVFLREVVARGEERTSRIHYINVTESIPSPPLGLEASFLSSSSIQLKWRLPDSPNGNIVRYNIFFQKSEYSFWEEQLSLDWCNRDIKRPAINKPSVSKVSYIKNDSCVCKAEKEQSLAVKADRDEHVFFTEFQERLNTVVFTKPKATNNHGEYNISRETTEKTKNAKKPTKKQISKAYTRKRKPNVSVSGNTYARVITGLDYFQNYEFIVCACTHGPYGGCARPLTGSAKLQCAVAQARTDVNLEADAIVEPMNVTILDGHQGGLVNFSWRAPHKPNAVVLKYEVMILYTNGNGIVNIYCRRGDKTNVAHTLQAGGYTAKVRAISPAGNGSWSSSVHFIVEVQTIEDNTLVLGVSVGASMLILVLIGFVIYYAFFKRIKEKNSPGVLYASVNPEYINSNEVYVPDEWELDRETIELLRELGQGSFGMVYEGIAHDINGQSELRVAVKTVNENASIRDRIEFLNEARIMKTFESNHVVRLIGVVSQGQPTFVVMELMAMGDLKTFLRSRRPEEKNSTLLPPMTSEMLQMAAEIADGMAYLAARKYIHRDLAARNCMVAADYTVKIGDFGMARDIYETDYYRKGGKGLLPVRWMAPESLRDGIFTTSSDIWSFGVVLWEIATLACQPYQGKTNEEVLRFVISGCQLEYPVDCDKQIRYLMERCWLRDPKQRISFLGVIETLEDHLTKEFMEYSFYHEMEEKFQKGNEYELLRRPISPSKTPPTPITMAHMKHDNSGSLSDDSGAFVENCNNKSRDVDRTANNLEHHNLQSFPLAGCGVTPCRRRLHDDEHSRHSSESVSVATSSRCNSTSSRPHHNSVYDNLEDSVTFGASPVTNQQSRNENSGHTKDLNLKNIFHGGKSIPV